MTDTFLEKIRKELHLSNCGFIYRKPDKFVRSQWQLQQKNVFYLLWRIVLAAFFIAAVVTSMASLARDDFRYYFIYFTNWGNILCMITSVYGAILVTFWHFNSRYAGKIDFHAKVEAAGNKLVVFDFHAIWCGPCKMISPALEELANSLVDKIVVLKIDVDECEQLA